MDSDGWFEGGAAAVSGFGYAPVDEAHISSLVNSLLPHLKGGVGSTLLLRGYKPPYSISKEEAQKEPDFMEFWISSTDTPDVAFSISFGGEDPHRALFEDLSIENLRAVALNCDPINLEAYVASFDELWVFACKLGESVGFESVKIRYGI